MIANTFKRIFVIAQIQRAVLMHHDRRMPPPGASLPAFV